MHYFLRNYKINAKIHNFSIRLQDWTTQAELPSFTFVALHSSRLWYYKYRYLTLMQSTTISNSRPTCALSIFFCALHSTSLLIIIS